MIRTILMEEWQLNEAEAEVIHDALGMVQDAVGPDLAREAQVDLARTIRECQIFNAPRTGSLKPGFPEDVLKLRFGGYLVEHIKGALDLMADWQAEQEKNPEDSIPGLTPRQQDALVDLRAVLGGES